MGRPASMFEFLVEPGEHSQRRPVCKVNGFCLKWSGGWDRLQGRGIGSQCFSNDTLYKTVQESAHTLALALNCSCSALEFKWPACGFHSPLPLPVPLSPSWPLVVLLCSLLYRFPFTFLQSSPSFHSGSEKPVVLIWPCCNLFLSG